MRNISAVQAPPPPPSVPMSSNYATIVDRFLAVLIDTIITLIIAFVLSRLFGIISIVPGIRFLFVPTTWIGFLVWVLYFGYFESTSGQTVGKQIVRIKVVDEQALTIIDMGRALVRNIVRIIDFLPFFYIIDTDIYKPKKTTLRRYDSKDYCA